MRDSSLKHGLGPLRRSFPIEHSPGFILSLCYLQSFLIPCSSPLHNNQVALVPPSCLWEGISRSIGFLLLLVDVVGLCGSIYVLHSFPSLLLSAFNSRPEVKLTHEQQRVLNHKIEHGQIVKIMAFAGKSENLHCKTECVTSNCALFPPASLSKDLCGYQGINPTFNKQKNNQSKLLQRNRDGKCGGYCHSSWVSVLFRCGTETKCQ